MLVLYYVYSFSIPLFALSSMGCLVVPLSQHGQLEMSKTIFTVRQPILPWLSCRGCPEDLQNAVWMT
jgi:hypothetical protein